MDSVTEVENDLDKVDSVDDVKEAVEESLDEKKPLLPNGTDEKTNGPTSENVNASSGTKVGRKGKKLQTRVYPPNGYAHAPRWPQLRKPQFQVLLGDSKLNKVIVQPIRITDLPLPRLDGLPSEPREFSLQFQAPPQANMYSFVLYASSDTYLGADVEKPIMVSARLSGLPESPPLSTFS